MCDVKSIILTSFFFTDLIPDHEMTRLLTGKISNVFGFLKF